MAIKHTIRYTRASTDTTWFSKYDGKSTDVDALAAHIKSTYEDNNRVSALETFYHADGEYMDVTRTFTTADDKAAFLADGKVVEYRTECDAYNSANNITKNLTVVNVE